LEPLRKLLKKNVKFIWNSEAESAFNKLKDAFLTNEILIYPDSNKEFIVETDASDFAVGCILSQISEIDDLVHPIAFHSRSLNKAELNYTIYDKEILAIITAFDVWHYHLEGAKFPVQVITDHKNLLYLKKSQHLNQRQIRWSIFLSKFDFRIAYRPGSCGKPDSLSRRPDYKKQNLQCNKSILNSNVFCCRIFGIRLIYQHFVLIYKLIEFQKSDKFCRNTLAKIKDKSNNIKSSLFTMTKGILPR